MSEPNDQQLSESLEAYLTQHAEVDEERLRERLADLVAAHPKRHLMELASQHGGALATQPVGDWKVKVSYVLGDRTALVGTIDIRDCVRGPGG